MSGKDHGARGAAGAWKIVHVIAHDLCHEANWHHGAVVADKRCGVHLVDGAVDGVVVVADGHGEAGAVDDGNDGVDVAVIVDAGTQKLADGAEWNEGAVVLHTGSAVDFNDASVYIHGVAANGEAHFFRAIGVAFEGNGNRCISQRAAQLELGVLVDDSVDLKAGDAVGIGANHDV